MSKLAKLDVLPACTYEWLEGQPGGADEAVDRILRDAMARGPGHVVGLERRTSAKDSGDGGPPSNQEDPSPVVCLLVMSAHATYLLERLRTLAGPEEAIWRGMVLLARLKQQEAIVGAAKGTSSYLKACGEAIHQMFLLVVEATEAPGGTTKIVAD